MRSVTGTKPLQVQLAENWLDIAAYFNCSGLTENDLIFSSAGSRSRLLRYVVTTSQLIDPAIIRDLFWARATLFIVRLDLLCIVFPGSHLQLPQSLYIV